ncbi:MAG: DUF882 domain-containing protein [Polyangia bacterium]
MIRNTLVSMLIPIAAAAAVAGPGPVPPAVAGESVAAPSSSGSTVLVARRERSGRRRCRARAPARYRSMTRRWREEPRIPGPRYRAGYRDLIFYAVNHGERIRVFPFLPDGTLDPEALERISHVLRDRHNEAVHPVHPRLVKILYRLVDYFDSKQITVISGYREADVGEGGHHSDGTAVDVALSGATLPRLAKKARRMGHVGVGYYPTAGFVHIDVRERSYFWADPSGPSYPGCPRQIMPKSAILFDSRWKPADDEPEPKRGKDGRLLGAIEPPPDAGPDAGLDAGPDAGMDAGLGPG